MDCHHFLNCNQNKLSTTSSPLDKKGLKNDHYKKFNLTRGITINFRIILFDREN